MDRLRIEKEAHDSSLHPSFGEQEKKEGAVGGGQKPLMEDFSSNVMLLGKHRKKGEKEGAMFKVRGGGKRANRGQRGRNRVGMGGSKKASPRS